ncbi:MAG: sugar phosphate isomerase/epimerase [Clostridia bacterium]|nr:sugar phosphate isomerase/epimerase [Clostridia bacterium]
MLKTAFSTLSMMNLSPDEVASLARELGFDGVEIRLGPDGTYRGLGPDDSAYIRRLFDGIELLSLNSGITVTPAFRDIDALLCAAAFASGCGAGGVRVFGDLSADGKIDFPALAESFKKVCCAAAGFGVKVLLETHGVLSAAADVRRLCDLVCSDVLGVIWDVHHTLEAGETVAGSASLLSGLISHVHLKDALFKDGGSVMTRLGDGELSPRDVREQLETVAPDCALSLEWEEYWRPELRGIYSSPRDLLDSYLDWIK